jgi:hypothetical protein
MVHPASTTNPTMKCLPHRLPGLLATMCLAAHGAGPLAVASGEYELTTQTVLPHLEEALRHATTRARQCLREPQAHEIFPLLLHPAFTGCGLVPDAAAADGLHFTLRCRNPEAASGTAVFAPEAGYLSGVLELKMGGKNMTLSQRVHGPRVGPCAEPGARTAPQPAVPGPGPG